MAGGDRHAETHLSWWQQGQLEPKTNHNTQNEFDIAVSYSTLMSKMTSTRHPVITDLPPTASIKHITLDDGQQASVVIQGGRITKILAANGQVAELSWKDDVANNNNNWRVKYHKSPPSEQ